MVPTFSFQHHPLTETPTFNMYTLILIYTFIKGIYSFVTTEDVQYLNELSIDKLLKLKSSLKELTTLSYDNVTTTTPTSFQSFGAQAMAMRAPVRRTDYEEGLYKKESKISNIFSISVTTLAFLAFGGYLLCLIVQAIKSKQHYNSTYPSPQPTTFFVSAGLKKKPQTQFASYGRWRRDNRVQRSFRPIDLPPEQLFQALLHICEGYAVWSEEYDV